MKESFVALPARAVVVVVVAPFEERDGCLLAPFFCVSASVDLTMTRRDA